MSKSHTFRRSWQLFRSSVQILVRHRKLLLFPVVSLLCTVAIALFFFAPIVLLPTGHARNQPEHWQALAARLGDTTAVDTHTQHWHPKTATCLYLVVIYLVSMVGATFFNVAFYNEIIRAFAGERVSLRGGLAFASHRLRAILLWSLLAGVVGLVIRGLEERFGWIGRLALGLVGMAWSVASVFVIPVMIREPSTNPFTLLKNSAVTLRKTWGEALIGYVGITFGVWIVLAGSFVFVVGVICLSVLLKQPVLILPAGVLWLLAIIAFLYVVSIADDIFRCALYVYASEGVVPAPYTAELMDAAWKVRKS
jgi:hypothetical protein